MLSNADPIAKNVEPGKMVHVYTMDKMSLAYNSFIEEDGILLNSDAFSGDPKEYVYIWVELVFESDIFG